MAAADLYDVRVALRDVLAGVSGVKNAHEWEAPGMVAPGVYVGDPEDFELTSASFGRGLLELTFPCTFVAGDLLDRSAARTVDKWVLSTSGVWGVLMADRTLGGVVDDCVPTTVQIGPVGDAERYGAVVRVAVKVRRDA